MIDKAEQPAHVLVTGGAGYIGSLLTGILLARGCQVTVVDDLLFGGEALLPYWHHPSFRFVKGDVCDPDLWRVVDGNLRLGPLELQPPTAVVHLAAIVGFPACQAVGREVAWRYNVEAVERMFALADRCGADRFIFSSTYSNYGRTEDGRPVTEESPLYPQSLYAETKIAAEQFLLEQATSSRVAPLCFRFATLFGISPRTRFDLIVNQFVLEALTMRKLIIYQRGYARSFVHVRDIVEALWLALDAPAAVIHGQVFNVGANDGNFTKDEIVALVQRYVPGTEVEYKDLTFGGDMRDIRVSFGKIREELGFQPRITVEDGVREVRDAIVSGLINNPRDSKYRNARFIVQ